MLLPSPCDDGSFSDPLLPWQSYGEWADGSSTPGFVMSARCALYGPSLEQDVSAQGALKRTVANVQLAVVCGDRQISPGDVIVADDEVSASSPRNVARVVLLEANRRNHELTTIGA